MVTEAVAEDVNEAGRVKPPRAENADCPVATKAPDRIESAVAETAPVAVD
jgi:hypothetical protein